MQAGWARREIAIVPRGLGMQGYGKWTQRDRGHKTPLYARAIALGEPASRALIFCCLDLGYLTHAMREGVIEAIAPEMGAHFESDRLVLTCTHTHSGPGGCSHDIMYNIVTPGFAPDYLAAIVAAAVAAIMSAWRGMAPATLALSDGAFAGHVDVAWNRSLAAYRRNPEAADQTRTHLALDRTMAVLSLRRDGGVEAMLSLFRRACDLPSAAATRSMTATTRAAPPCTPRTLCARPVRPIRWRSSLRHRWRCVAALSRAGPNGAAAGHFG